MMSDRLDAIGGEFSVSGQDFLINRQQSAGVWPEYAGKQSLRCDSGRSALLLALRHWQHERGCCQGVWLPSYLCPSVQDTICRAGWQVHIYDDGPGETIPFVPPVPRDGDLVVVVHYFGHVNLRVLTWLLAASSPSWGVIEDCVQAPYSAGVGVTGCYAITSLRKWWSAPDGATLHFQGKAWSPALLESDEGFVSRRLLAKMLRSFGGEAENLHLRLLGEAEARLDQLTAARNVSWVSETLLATADLDFMIRRRRQNWARLAESLPQTRGWRAAYQPLYATLAVDAVPLVFPVLISARHRDALRAQLASSRIFCPVHWRLSESTPSAEGLAGTMLSLPIDQRYSNADMDSMVQVVSHFFEGVGS